MKNKIKLVELFSGIGSQAKALELVAKNKNFEVDVVHTCEWDIHSILAYDIIHNNNSINENVFLLSKDTLKRSIRKYTLSNDGKSTLKNRTINLMPKYLLQRIVSSIINTKNLVNIKEVKGYDLESGIDIMTYSFPCQDLSNVGALHGYNKGIDRNSDSRSGLLWEVERILLERKNLNYDLPKILLLENVTSLEAKRHQNNFLEWQESLNKLGYINKVYKLYAPNFGVPQNRKRLLMISVLVNKENQAKIEQYFESNDLETYRKKTKPLKNYLHLDKSEKYFIEGKECQPKNTKSREDIWIKNPKIVDGNNNIQVNIIPTITTKQDRHPNSGNIYFDYENNIKAKFRFLTPRECFQLMGFEESDYQKLIDSNFYKTKNSKFFSRDRLYKLAGNSIVVDVLVKVFEQIIDLIELIDEEQVRQQQTAYVK